MSPITQAPPATTPPETPLKIHRTLGSRISSVLLWPFKAIGQAIVKRIHAKFRYEAVYLWFHSYNVATCAYVATKLHIFDHLKAGPKSSVELAQLTGADQPTLYRMLRGLAALGFLKQLKGDSFSVSPQGELLQEDHPQSLHHWAIHWGQDVLPVLQKFEQQVTTGESNAFDLTHGQSYWDYLSDHPEAAITFNEKMSQLTVQHVPAIVDAFDFSDVGTLVDVGGGHGSLLCAILEKHSQVNGVLYDRTEVEAGAKDFIKTASLDERCTMVTGSFLDSVPADGDTYLIKHVLHDWDDDSVRKILKNVRDAMQPGQRLLIIEGFVEHEHFGSDIFRKWADIYQMVYLPGKQRTLDEMRSLLGEAGFQMKSLTPTAIIDVAVLESIAIA